MDARATQDPADTAADSRADAARGLLSVVLPAYNEREVLPSVHARFAALAGALAEAGLDLELVFVNDGSSDGTAELLNRMAAEDPRVRAVHLTRNFGHQAAVTAGLSVARGDAVAVMDCDLQDPPEVLPQFVEKWREGYQVVYAVRANRKEGPFKRMAYWSFYRLMALISDLDIPLDSGDFCLMDRSAVDLLNSLPEQQRFVRGLRTWIGLRQAGVRYDRDARQAGRPSHTFRSLVRLATDGLVSFSDAPLRAVTWLGVLGAIMAVALGVWVVVALFVAPQTPRGWTSTACLILFTSSLQLLSIGMIGQYLSRIFLEVKGRPTFLIASVVGGDGQDVNASRCACGRVAGASRNGPLTAAASARPAGPNSPAETGQG